MLCIPDLDRYTMHLTQSPRLDLPRIKIIRVETLAVEDLDAQAGYQGYSVLLTSPTPRRSVYLEPEWMKHCF